MLDNLFLNTFDQTPTLTMRILFHFPLSFESVQSREEGRLVELAVFELFDGLLNFFCLGVDVVLSDVIAAYCDLAGRKRQFYKPLGIGSKYRVFMIIEEYFAILDLFFFPLKLLLIHLVHLEYLPSHLLRCPFHLLSKSWLLRTKGVA